MCPHQTLSRPAAGLDYYRKKLSETLRSRKALNPSYSLRAFARSLGIHAASLSSVINGKRPLPSTHLERTLAQLSLNADEKALFTESVQRDRQRTEGEMALPRRPNTCLNEDEHFVLISEWEHGAIICLMETRGFRPHPAWIARRLGLTIDRAERCLENLIRLGLVRRTASGTLRKTRKSFQTSDEVKSLALRRFHRSILQIAERKLERVPLELRDFTGVSMPLDPDKIPEVKARIRRFYREIERLAATPEAREVYQISIQLFPLTEESTP